VASIISCPNCGKRNRLAPTAEGVPRCANCHELLPWLVDADAGSFDAELRASVPVLIEFWAPWCGPCKMVAPAVEALAREKAGQLKVAKVNIDDSPSLAERYEVRGIPALVLARNGAEVDRFAGAVPKRVLDEWLARHISSPTEAAK
jgi:thioredoxin 2